MARPQGTKYWKGGSAGGTVMTGIGNLYSLFISYYGVTAGDRVAVYDGTTQIAELVFPATGGNFSLNLPAVGIEFATSLVVSPTITGGELNITVGYAGNG